LRFVVDHILPRDLAEYLISEGHKALTVGRLKTSARSDEAIWQYAESIQAIVISKDSDYLPLANEHAKIQFVHLRCGNLSTAKLLDLFRARMPQVLQALNAGERIVEVR
jgi:predicted nuclease of predicted toxin-antitoxin system